MPHEFLQDDYLREMFAERNGAMAYIERAKSKFNLGADIVGFLAVRTQAIMDMVGMSEMGDRLAYAPGDRQLQFRDNQIPVRVGVGMPIAYDIWYVFPAGNILEFGGKGIEESMEKMADFFDSVDNASPLCLCSDPPAPGPHTIKQARFEITPGDNSAGYGSVGPKTSGGDYSGFIAFPVGPLGVMWGVSVATQSSLEGEGTSSSVHPVDGSNGVLDGGELLPPFKLDKEQIFGEILMTRGWLTEDDSVVELYAEPIGDDPPEHKWLRYWIKEDNTTIVPGEFVGLMCRPWPLHCWWYQETAPFVYAGNWIESEFYTSGIVKEVIPPEEGEVGNRYRVWVKNEEIIVKSTDFLGYEVDEQVGILKTYREGEGETYDMSMGPADNSSGQTTNFNWQHLALQNTGEELNADWVIVPAGFYDEGGSGVGGT